MKLPQPHLVAKQFFSQGAQWSSPFIVNCMNCSNYCDINLRPYRVALLCSGWAYKGCLQIHVWVQPGTCRISCLQDPSDRWLRESNYSSESKSMSSSLSFSEISWWWDYHREIVAEVKDKGQNHRVQIFKIRNLFCNNLIRASNNRQRYWELISLSHTHNHTPTLRECVSLRFSTRRPMAQSPWGMEPATLSSAGTDETDAHTQRLVSEADRTFFHIECAFLGAQTQT